MCKHIAAVLYGVGARLDQQPELLFTLRAVDQAELIGNLDSGLLSKTGQDAAKVLADDDLSALFGLDMAKETPPANVPETTKPVRAKPVKSERAKSSTADASKRAVAAPPKGGGAAGSKPRRVKAAPPVPARTPLEKTSARRGAAAQVTPTATTRLKVSAPGRANAARQLTRVTAETPTNTTARTKSGGPAGLARSPFR